MCQPGKYSDEIGEIDLCKHCPSGKFSAIEATSTCTDCRQGYYSNEVGGASICKLCSTGQYANTDA
jgi:hypothetical protein